LGNAASARCCIVSRFIVVLVVAGDRGAALLVPVRQCPLFAFF
jgi:hypothetical protein